MARKRGRQQTAVEKESARQRQLAGLTNAGKGRPKGVPNKTTREAKVFCNSLVDDPAYQKKLRADFLARRCSDPIEQMIWHYAKGKPKDRVEFGADKSLADLIREAVQLPDPQNP